LEQLQSQVVSEYRLLLQRNLLLGAQLSQVLEQLQSQVVSEYRLLLQRKMPLELRLSQVLEVQLNQGLE
jgi:hypothetical protein